ncbi:MAG: RDD family protein [Pirellulaceae bacterium]
MAQERSLGDGVYFDEQAYPGIVRRLLIWIVDCLVLLVIAFLVAVLAGILLVMSGEENPRVLAIIAWMGVLLFSWIYLTQLKRSKWRTVGYRLLDVKMVNLQGNRPSLWAMHVRLLLILYWPFTPVISLLWIGADKDRQTLRDCYAGVYLIRSNAVPVGTGPLHLVWYFAFGHTFSYPRVQRNNPVAAFQQDDSAPPAN